MQKICLSLFALLIWASFVNAKPLKVFILAGQSNMQGHAKSSVIDYMKEDKKSKYLHRLMHENDGTIKVCKNVFISYLTGGRNGNDEVLGPLTVGYGARKNPLVSDDKMGPELTFGIVMNKLLDEPVLIIKTAWGGKSLFKDFRPPSAGPYQPNESEMKRKYATKEQLQQLEKETGLYYRLMIEHVRKVLKDIKRVYPHYKESQGYQLSGFVWFQGWNDMVNRNVYPTLKKGQEDNRFSAYSENLSHLIRDVRKDLKAPEMPFCIGVMGVGGVNASKNLDFRQAMAAPASYPEFKKNVVAVETAPFWDEKLDAVAKKLGQVKQMSYFLRIKHKKHANKDGSMSPQEQKKYVEEFKNKLISKDERELFAGGASNAAYHYLGCAKTMALIGEAFAKSIHSKLP